MHYIINLTLYVKIFLTSLKLSKNNVHSGRCDILY